MRTAGAFSGIGGFELASRNLGWPDPEVMIERDPSCQRVLARHFPTVPLKGDICDVTASDLGRPDIWHGGFPCQDTSIAAPHRTGLAGKRSSHYFEFQRLLGEYLRLVDATRPRWVVIENPVGLLASPGRGKDGIDRRGWDMAAVVRGVEDLGYGWAYRVVDAGQLGTPQRRERVIVVGHLGGDPRPAGQVLGVWGAGSTASAPHPVGGTPSGPAAHRHLGVAGEPVVFRKSARPRAALTKGGYETWVDDGRANTLTGFDSGGPLRQTHLVMTDGRLRTLTFREWERLQGFPDDWTQGMPASDRRVNGEVVAYGRGSALGNAIHVGTPTWVFGRIQAVHSALPQLTTI